MSGENSKSFGVISMARNDGFFIPGWIRYYGLRFGYENIFLILDGLDQPLPADHELINVIRLPHRALSRASGDSNRSKIISCFAKALFYRYDIIIAHDIDEILVVDPDTGQSLGDYLSGSLKHASLSALGLDVGQHLELEKAIDPGRPFLEQRSFAHVSARYTKPVVATRPVNWGAGFHRVKGRNFHIDPNMYLFHFGMVDYERSKARKDDQALIDAGWSGHFDRRNMIFDLIIKKKPVDGDEFFNKARRRESLFRSLFAWNKPAMLGERPVIRIPERFRSVI